jgi:cytochrome oxidase Cu insertion factor (SCO1/SenC/PrrC family)
MTPRVARVVALVFALAAVGGISLGLVAHVALGEVDGPSPTLPGLHGQATWASGKRPAPPFRLRDHDGELVSLAALRGRPVLVTFLDSLCEEQCTVTGRQLGRTLRRLDPEDRPALVVVSVDPAGDTPKSIRRAMVEWRLAGPWRWHWLRGTRRELARVWAAYGIVVQPTTNDITHGLALYLVDRRGFQRTGYLFPFLPNFVQHDLEKLAQEKA